MRGWAGGKKGGGGSDLEWTKGEPYPAPWATLSPTPSTARGRQIGPAEFVMRLNRRFPGRQAYGGASGAGPCEIDSPCSNPFPPQLVWPLLHPFPP